MVFLIPLITIGILLLAAAGVVLGVYLKHKSLDPLKPFCSNVLHWRWVKAFLYWLIISVGTMSECVFLIASLWMTVNSSVHDFVRLFLSEDATIHLSWLATVTFVAVPEFILALALVTTISHIRVWWYSKKDIASATWAVLYGLPTLAFLILSVVVISNSMLSTHYKLDDWMVVVRGLAGYMYGFVAILYWQLGNPQEVDRLKQKDDFISQLVENARLLTEQIDGLKAEMERQKNVLAEQKTAHKRLIEETQKSDDAALQAYGDEVIQWLRSGVKTVLPDEIIRFTGFSKRKITNALDSGKLQVSPRNKDLILVSSLISWLKTTPSPVNKLSIVRPIEEDDSDTDELESVTG
jgi:hypothetical protein